MTNEVLFFEYDTIQSIIWENYHEGEKVKQYFSPMIENTTKYIQNVNTTIGFMSIDNLLLPYTVNEADYDNSYVVSPYNHYITYAKEELSMLNQPLLEKLFAKLIDVVGLFTKKIHINQVVYVNNWLLSTNLFTNLTEEQIERATLALLKKFPQHVIAFRSINDRLANEIMLLFIRTVYRNRVKTLHVDGFRNIFYFRFIRRRNSF